MDKPLFIFNDAFNKFNIDNDKILRSHISTIKEQCEVINKEDLQKLITTTKDELKIDLTDNINKFSDECINNISKESVKKVHDKEPILFEVYVKSLHSAQFDFLISVYDYETSLLKGQ